MHGTIPALAPTVAEPSLAGLVAWLVTQDPETKYHYMDAAQCVCGQYCCSIGLDTHSTKRWTFEAKVGKPQHIFSGFPHTYGAALTRARAALAEREG